MRQRLMIGIVAAALGCAAASGCAQMQRVDLPDGPVQQGLLPDTETAADSAGLPQGSQAPSPIPPSSVNPSAGATSGPLTQADRNRYVLRQLVAPSHVFGYSASALIRMANPPGRGATYYPPEWRVGGPGFGRNFGDSAARDQAKHIAKYGSGALLREDPRYFPSDSTNYGMRAMHAVLFTLVDRSNDGRPRPAISNFVGAAAGGYVGDAYLPPGFRNQSHATQRALSDLGGFAGENVLAEFKPEIRLVLLKLHAPFVK